MHTSSLYGVINVRETLDMVYMYHIKRETAPALHCLSIGGVYLYRLSGTLTVILGTSKVVLSGSMTSITSGVGIASDSITPGAGEGATE